MSQPDGRLQRAAIVLAEELNFTRAADRLRISQSGLSRQIVDLEERIGFAVFKRNQKSVELTEPGEVFIRGCLDAQALIDKALRLAKSTQENAQPHITVGHSPYADPALISEILSVHLPLHPNLRLRVESMFGSDLVHGVLTAELDLALIADPPANPSLTLAKIATSPLCVAIPSDHRMASSREVSLEDFRNEGWIIFPKRAHPTLYAGIFDTSRRAAVSPIELHHYVSPQEAARLVSQNFGIALIAKGVAEQIASEEILVKPLSEASLKITSYLVLRADQSSRIINDFGRAFLRKVAPASRRAESSGQLALAL